MSTDPQPQSIPLAYAATAEQGAAARFLKGAAWLALVHAALVTFGYCLWLPTHWTSSSHGSTLQRVRDLSLVILWPTYGLSYGIICVLVLRRRAVVLRWLVATAVLIIFLALTTTWQYLDGSGLFDDDAASIIPRSVRMQNLLMLLLSSCQSLPVAAAFFLLARSRLLRNYLGTS